MTPLEKYWRTSCPQMQFPVRSLGSLVELLRAYIGVMIAPYDIIITSPKKRRWKISKGMPLERKHCERIEDEVPHEEV